MKRIILFGDSNTYGFDPRDFFGGRYDPEYRWVDILQKKNPQWELINCGENGREIPYRESHYRSLTRMIDRNRPVDVFAVMLGTNDLLCMFNASAEAIAERMQILVEDVKEQLKNEIDCRILLIAPIELDLGPGEEFENYHRISVEMRSLYKKIAADEDIDFADAGDWGIDVAHDRVHFSETGHAQFAEKMQKVLEEIAGE